MIPYSRYLIYPVTWYGTLILTGVLLAVFIAYVQGKKKGFPEDTIIDLALRIIPVGILCARIYYVIFSWKAFQNDLLSVFRIWEGGLAIYGGVLGGLITIVVFCRKRHLSIRSVCDVIVPGLSLAQAVGRWGNYFNMEAYGRSVTDPSFCFFPAAVLIPSDTGSSWHLATFFYESCWDFIVFVILMLLSRKKQSDKGYLLRTYLVLYASARLVIEELREDSLYLGGIRISQLLSILIILMVFLVMICRLVCLRKQKKLPLAMLAFEPVYLFASVNAVCCAAGCRISWFKAFSERIFWYCLFSILSVSHLIILNGWISVRRSYANIKD